MTQSVLDRICELLKNSPPHAESAQGICRSPRGLLVFFLPEKSVGGTASGWQAILGELTSAHEALAQSGFSVLAVCPDINESSFERELFLPYPTIHLTANSGLAQELWQILQPDEQHMFAYVAWVEPQKEDLQKQDVTKIWAGADSGKLVPEVLVSLYKKKLLIYVPDSEIVRHIEHAHLQRRRKKAAVQTLDLLEGRSKSAQGKAVDRLMKENPAGFPVGLAFSGGGIRSATFNLGLTQSLARYRFLPWVDYLASVSGGGFTAGALVSLLSRRPNKGTRHFNTQWEQFPFNPEIEAFTSNIDLDGDEDQRENRNFRDVSHEKGHNQQLSYLIKNGNYLVPRLGLATRDLMRGVGTLLSGIGFTLLLFLLAMFGFACLHYFSASLFTPALVQDYDTTRLAAQKPEAGGDLGLTLADEYSLVTLLFGSYSPPPTVLEPGEATPKSEPMPYGIYLGMFGIGMVASYLVYLFLAATYSYPDRRKQAQQMDREAGEDQEDAEDQEEEQDESQPKQGSEKKDLFFPAPKYLLRFVWPLLLGALGLLGWNLLGKRALPPFSDLIYPLAFILAGLLVWLLLKGVPGKGTTPSERWQVWLYLLLLLGLGVSLVLPGIHSLASPNPDVAGVWLPLAIGLFVFMLVGIYRQDVWADRWGRTGFDRWEWYDPFALRMILGLLVGIMLLSIAFLKEIFGRGTGTTIFWIWQPAAFFAGALIFLIIFRLLFPGLRRTWGSSRFRTMLWALVGMNLYSLLAAAFFGALALPQILAVGGDNAAIPPVPLGAALISGLWAAFLAQFSGKETTGESTLKKIVALPSGIRNFVLGLLVVVLWFSLIFIFETALDRIVQTPIQALGYGLVALAVFIALGSLQNFNYLSPHYFFGDRAAEVFLKTEVELKDGRVATVRDETAYDLKAISPATSSAPYHLVVAAVNMAGSGHQQDRDRKSRHFVFSKEFVGSDATGYVNTDIYRGGGTYYASTLALSGAAASPGLGTFTFFAQAFMMTLLNVRLGLWWLNPREYRGYKTEDELEKIKTFEDRAFWPVYLLDEALAKTSERRRLVNITDGGHTRDNGGLYPLFERRCKLIIAGDASQDSEGLCHDLFSLLHYVRVDLDIQVDISVSRLQPAAESKDDKEAGMSEAHCAIGRIHYPAVYHPDGSLKQPEEKGWLVYFKPAITKSLPSEVLQFWQTDKNMFPHPTTADQFFTERQFEAQRRLGEASVRLSLKALLDAYAAADTKLKDPGNAKRNLVKNILENQVIDYAELNRQPGLFDRIMQDWMDTLSPLK